MLCLLVAIPAAYASARMEFTGRLFRQFLLVTQMLSPIVLVLGIFRLMAKMGMVDQLPGARPRLCRLQPRLLRLDAAGLFPDHPARNSKRRRSSTAPRRFQRLRLVFLPLAAPAIGITAVFIFIYCWNEFVLAMTLLRSPDKHTLTFQIFSTGRRALPGRVEPGDGGDAGRQPCPSPSSSRLLQRYLVSGLTVGAVK